MNLKVIETEPQSPFDSLWRQFPQLKNAVCIDRSGWGGGVSRTFRLLDGSYICIRGTEEGDELLAVPDEEIKIYEDVWKQLGPKAISRRRTNRPQQAHGIVWASDEFFAEVGLRELDSEA